MRLQLIGAQNVKGNLPKNNVAKIFEKKSQQTEKPKKPNQKGEQE